jgi:AraC-like DNA-binding protein
MEELLYYRHNLKSSQSAIAPHYINFDEITAVFEGTLVYTINGVEYNVNAGDIIYIRKGSSRSRKPIDKANYVSLNFSPIENYSFPILFEGGLSEILRLFLTSMDAIYEFTHTLNDERFTLLLQCILKQLQTQLKADKEHSLVVKIKEYIKHNLSSKITLSSVCNHVFFSPVYLESLFKQETGQSIIDYALNEKIKIAKMLIIEGSSSLVKVAAFLGFEDYNYFSRLFKKRVGVSPLAFKKQLTFKDKK